MEDNLARDLELDIELEADSVTHEQQITQPLVQPREEPTPSVEPIPQVKPAAKGLTKLEIGLVSLFTSIVFALILFNVYSDLQLTTVSRDVQDVNAQIEQTEVEIENLKQHTQELTRYDRINEIAEKYGLELHEENIRNLVPKE
ncbi:cell division protein FtsL [Atopostipes suicloacalis DSM 15692]|uniref:Cell division protein FtsL n=1 Tax=Atopostipes suicloacalis DSM 15692 TaxID=1121025 RepID=A0A1M4SZY2_9LACT|nr:cell division protein FtsL [Atopostipes suicloacalis]SHE37761.1 cell division protein FtsL [Atopostipes suicloacalis DSM 15692]